MYLGVDHSTFKGEENGEFEKNYPGNLVILACRLPLTIKDIQHARSVLAEKCALPGKRKKTC